MINTSANFGDGSVLQFTPDHSRMWILEYDEVDPAAKVKQVKRLPVIGWAVVILGPYDSRGGPIDIAADQESWHQWDTAIEAVVIGTEGQAQDWSSYRRASGAPPDSFLIPASTPEEWDAVAKASAAI